MTTLLLKHVRRDWKHLFLCSLMCLLIGRIAAQPALGFNKILSGLSSPVDLKNANDGSQRLFIVEQPGRIRIYKNGNLLSKPFLDVSSLVKYRGGEQGLLSIAFPPNYKKVGYFFVYYTATNENVTLARYRVRATNPDVADPASGVILFSYPKPGGFGNHNGGTLQFGKEGYLYISIGDGGSEDDPNNNGQNGKSYFGKMLRLDVNMQKAPYYKIPGDNPFVADPGVFDEIWALGLRNPWKWSFDRQNGNTWIGDVGQDTWEEIDFEKPKQAAVGVNYGWRCYEGHASFNLDSCKGKSNYNFPIFDYKHDTSNGGDCVIGGYVYRGTSYPALQGYYICSDYISGNAWEIRSDGSGGWNVYLQKNIPAKIVSYGEDESGELYASSLTGDIYHVIATANPIKSLPVVQDASANIISFVYPTFVQNRTITIQLNNTYKLVRLVDMSGTEVFRRDINGTTGEVSLHLPSLSAGTYIVQLIGSRMLQQKIYVAN